MSWAIPKEFPTAKRSTKKYKSNVKSKNQWKMGAYAYELR